MCQNVTIDCQAYGSSVTGKEGTTTIWDHVPGKGYITDAYVYTGSSGMIAPLCGGANSTCEAAGISNPNTCAVALAWAKSHITTVYHSDYYDRCDHVAGLEYGYSASGFVSAIAHWNAIPAKYKHVGDRDPPPAGLTFYNIGEYGHVCISTGGEGVISNDINGDGTLTESTISIIESRWAAKYLGWANPWFR